MFWNENSQLKELAKEIERLTLEVASLRAEKKGITEQRSLEDNITALKKQVADLEINRDKKQEAFDRRERELTHMIGLEKQRQAVETRQATEDAKLTVREENLKAEKQQFESQMKFREERFDSEVAYLQDLMKQILGRLPSVTIDRNIEERATKKRR